MTVIWDILSALSSRVDHAVNYLWVTWKFRYFVVYVRNLMNYNDSRVARFAVLACQI